MRMIAAKNTYKDTTYPLSIPVNLFGQDGN